MMRSPLADNFWDVYSGEREVLGHALFNHDPFDQFAWVQGWRFAIADYLVWELGEYVPEFRSYAPEEDAYEFETLKEIDASAEACQYALRILDRFREWLEIAEETY